jgi:NADPH:quinone reductase-like Zn-dependent oxidoreductase
VPAGSRLAGRGDIYGELGVIGANADGGYAELCLVPRTHVHAVPDHLDDVAAAVFPTTWLTAWHALIEVGRLQAGETIMIHAAGAGVSVAAIALARWRGATVLATAGGPDKTAQALALGAHFACDNRSDDVTAFAFAATHGRGVDMVLDHVGPALFAASQFSMAPKGRIVVCGNTTGDQVTIPSLGHLFHTGVSIIGSDPYRYAEFAEAWAVYCQLAPTPVVAATFELTELAAAQSLLEGGSVFGKVVVRP